MTQPVEQPTNNESVVEFVPLLHFEDQYEILNQFPFTIRNKSNHYVLKDTIRNDGYIQVYLNGKTYYKHMIIAKQFLEKDDPGHKTQVDHISRDRTIITFRTFVIFRHHQTAITNHQIEVSNTSSLMIYLIMQ